MQRNRSLVYLFLISLIWGTSYLMVQEAIDNNVSVSFVMALRFLISALFLYIVARGKISAGKYIKSGLIGGLFVFLGFFLQNSGQKTANISSVALLTATNVFMIPLLRWAIYKKKLDAKTIICCFISFLGAAVLGYKEGFALSFSFGEVLVLLAAFFFAMHMVYLDSKVRKEDTQSLVFWQMLFAGLYGLVFMLFANEVPGIKELKGGLLPVIYVGIFATGLCYFLQAKAQKHISAPLVGMILALESIFGVVFSIALNYENYDNRLLIGAFLIVGPIIIMEGLGQKNLKSKKA